MTNYEMLLKINDKARENIGKLYTQTSHTAWRVEP